MNCCDDSHNSNTMTTNFLRQTIINVLDDEHGINSRAHDCLAAICSHYGWEDINRATELQNGRAFLNEDDAEDLHKVAIDNPQHEL